tara:strand:- start:1021 stop:1728 length:708 start_codon:yes stop_codon:yes gene_type:complete
LVYVPACYTACGDAYCCNYTRTKSRFALIARVHAQELPLLPGEYEFLTQQGWLEGFGEHEHKVEDYVIDDRRALRVESLVSPKAGCACQHDSRTTTCRLYPLLPRFDVQGRLVGVDRRFGIFEEIVALDQEPQNCKVEILPFDQIPDFLAITTAIGEDPELAFYVQAYGLAKVHVAQRLGATPLGAGEDDHHQRFEMALLRRELFDHDALRADLAELADRYEAAHGSDFCLSSRS